MIICLCYNISEKDVKKLIEEGKNLEEIKSTLGVGSSCGSCIRGVEELIDEALELKTEK